MRPEPRDLFRHGWFTSPRDSSPCGSSPCDTSPCGSLCFCFLARVISGRSVPSLTCLCPLSGTPLPPVADSSARSVAKSPSPKPIVCSLRVVFGGCARSLRAAVDAVVASFGAAAIALLSRRRSTRRRSCAPRACRAAASDAAWWRSAAAPSAAAARAHSAMCVVVGGVAAFFGCGRRRAALAAPLHAAPLVCSPRPPCRRIRCGVVALGRRSSAAAARALSAVRVVVGGCARSLRAAVDEVVASFGAAAVALLSRRRSTRRHSCALRARCAAASDAAWWRSAAAPLRRRLAPQRARAGLCVRPSTRSSRPSGRPPSRCSRGAAPRGAARVLYAPAVPPHPMRRGGARPPLLCGGGSRSQRGARRGRWLLALSACGRRRGRRVLRGGRRRAALAAPLHAAPLVCSTRPPCRRIRCGVVALGRRSSAAAARALSAVRVVVGGGARSLRAAVDEVVAFFGAAAVALLSRRRSTRRRSCALRARRAAASDAAWWRSAAAPLRRRLALSARCASWSVAARALCVRPSTRSSRPSGRPPSRCSRGAAPRGAARVLYAPAVPPHPMRRGGARPPLLCGGGSRSQRGARRGRWLRALSACGRRRGRRVLRGGRRRAALAAPLHAAPLVCSTRPPCRRIRCGVVALGRRSSAAAARALSAVRVVVGGCSRSLRAAVGKVSRPSGRPPSRCSRGAAPRGAARVLYAPAVPPHPMRRGGARPPLLCGGGSCSQRGRRVLRGGRRRACSRGAAPRGAARVLYAPAVPPHPMRRGGARPPLLCGGGSRSQRGARRGRWLLALSACGRRRGRRILRGGRHRAALAAPLHAAPLVCSTRLPCRRIRCGVAALGRRSSAAAARALSAVRVVVGGGARSLRAAVDEVVASFGAAAVALLSRRRSTRRRSCALRARRAAASDAAWWRSAAAPLRRRLALSARCASWSVAARALCVRPSTRSSRSSGRPPSRCSRGAAPRGAARVLYAPAVPPHPMRRGGARPPLLCGGGSRSQRGARRGRWLLALSARGRRQGVASFGPAAIALLSRRRSTRRCSCALRACRDAASDAAWRRSSAAPLRRRLVLSARSSRSSGRPPSPCSRGAAPHGAARVLYAPAVPPHLMRRGGARPPLLCGSGSRPQRGACRGRWRRALSACGRRRGRRVLRGGRRRAALAAPLHAAPLLCSTRLPCRRIRCGVVALGRRSSAAAARALSAVRVVVGGGARSLRASVDEVSRPSGRPPPRCSCGAAPRGAARVLYAPAVPPHPMRRGGARPPLLCGGGSRSQRGARRGRWRRALSACGRRRGRRVLRGDCCRAALAAPLHAAPLVRSTRPPCRRVRCGVVALGRRSSAAAARALSAVRVVVGGAACSLCAVVDGRRVLRGGRRRAALAAPPARALSALLAFGARYSRRRRWRPCYVAAALSSPARRSLRLDAAPPQRSAAPPRSTARLRSLSPPVGRAGAASRSAIRLVP